MTLFPNVEVRGEPRPQDLEANEWDADAYVEAVESILRRIGQARVGRTVLAHVSRRLVIQPHREHRGFSNASSTVGFDWAHETPPDAEEQPGTGLGSWDVHVGFTPALFLRPDGVNDAAPGLHPFHGDSVLVHEIFHAIESMAGRTRYATMGRSATDFQRITEHRAVRVTNMYRSETHRPLRGPYRQAAFLASSGQRYDSYGLRGLDSGRGLLGYRGVRSVARVPGDPRHEHYIDFEVRLIGEMMLDHPALTDALLGIPRLQSPYNPFRDFMEGRFDTVLVAEYWAPSGYADDHLPNVG